LLLLRLLVMLLERRRRHAAVRSGHVGHSRAVVVVAAASVVVVVVVVAVGRCHDLQRHLRVLVDHARGASGARGQRPESGLAQSHGDRAGRRVG